MAKKKTIKEIVIENKDTILGLDTTSTKELRDWGLKQGWDSRAGFSRYKKALLEIGIDYNRIKKEMIKKEKEEKESKVSYEVTLFSDYKLGTNRFCITNEKGNPIWYGIDFDYPAHQAEGELGAASKAVWLAGKIREELNVDYIRLNLNVDADWLCFQDNPKQKGYKLSVLADKYKVILNVDWISGSENPADGMTAAKGGGYMSWRECGNVSALANPV